MSSHPDRECPLDGNDWPPRGCDCSPYSLPTRVFISRMLVDLGDRGGGLFLCKAAGVGRKSPSSWIFCIPFCTFGVIFRINQVNFHRARRTALATDWASCRFVKWSACRGFTAWRAAAGILRPRGSALPERKLILLLLWDKRSITPPTSTVLLYQKGVKRGCLDLTESDAQMCFGREPAGGGLDGV